MEPRDPSPADSLAEIARRYGPWIHARLRARYPEDVDDLEQEVMFKLWKALPRLRGNREESLRAVIGRVVRSVLVDEFRRRRALPLAQEPPEEFPEARTAALDAVEVREEAERVESLYRYLTEEQHRILKLRFRDGLGLREIAEILGLPRGTVAGWYSRALAIIRENLP